ncbi:hypothetical protein [Spartinivicinus marinus]|nr:hypothetical protein [Spartinivicinus marinus]
MDTLLELLKQQPETIKPEQKVSSEKAKNNDVDSGGGHCQGGGDW